MDTLIGRDVEVAANAIVYRGKLVEMTDTEIHLETEAGWIVIPCDRVASIREKSSPYLQGGQGEVTP